MKMSPQTSATGIRLIAWFLCLIAASSRVLDASETCVGDWDLNLKCGKKFFSSILFPSLRLDGVDANKPLSRPHTIFGLSQDFPCRLSIFPNGTFALRPSARCPPSRSLNMQQDHSQTDNNNNILLLRGRWQVEANPYCVTDRFHDNLHLKSYPRRLVKKTGGRKKRDPERDTLLWQKGVSLSLHCRICGRYATPGIWKRTALLPSKRTRNKETRARMTHGLLLWGKNDGEVPPRRTQRQRDNKSIVGASFRGKRIVRRNVASQYEVKRDLDTFGY